LPRLTIPAGRAHRSVPAKKHTYGMIEGELGKLKAMRRKASPKKKK
jgi:hypothetical protein